MFKGAFISLLVLCSLFSCAQADSSFTFYTQIKGEVTCYTPTYYPASSFELEIPFGKRIALVLGGGPLINFNFPKFVNGVTSQQRTGFILSPSVKFYGMTTGKNNRSRPYASVEVLYRESTFERNEYFKNPGLNNSLYQDTITIHHLARGMSVNMGAEVSFGRFGLEFRTGIGFIYTRNSFSNEIIPNATLYKGREISIWKSDYFIPRFPLKIFVYYEF